MVVINDLQVYIKQMIAQLHKHYSKIDLERCANKSLLFAVNGSQTTEQGTCWVTH